MAFRDYQKNKLTHLCFQVLTILINSKDFRDLDIKQDLPRIDARRALASWDSSSVEFSKQILQREWRSSLSLSGAETAILACRDLPGALRRKQGPDGSK